MTMDIHDILKRLPHRYPFLLVDRVLAIDKGKSIKALKNVTINEPFFMGHFPHRPVMPGVLMLEAMARGKPVVTTRVGGNPEVVADSETGLLVPASDPSALADAIGAILSDPVIGQQMGVAGRQRVENNFDIRKMMAQYESMYTAS